VHHLKSGRCADMQHPFSAETPLDYVLSPSMCRIILLPPCWHGGCSTHCRRANPLSQGVSI
jgi:hypothetical protein